MLMLDVNRMKYKDKLHQNWHMTSVNDFKTPSKCNVIINEPYFINKQIELWTIYSLNFFQDLKVLDICKCQRKIILIDCLVFFKGPFWVIYIKSSQS